jgi:hypothetical protein
MKMANRVRKMSRLIFAITAGLIFLSMSASVRAEGLLDKLDIKVDISGSIDYYSTYVWRGFTLDTDPVIQPGVNISALGFTYSFWSSWDANANDELTSDEIDHVFDYTKEINDLVSISLGHTYYDFPAAETYSREFYAGFSLSRIPGTDIPIETSLTYAHDYGDESNGGGDGDYVSLDFAYSHTLIEDIGMTADFGLHYGYNNELFIAGQGSDLALSFGFTIPLNDNVSLSPVVVYAAPFGDLKKSSDGGQSDRVYGGISLAWAF